MFRLVFNAQSTAKVVSERNPLHSEQTMSVCLSSLTLNRLSILSVSRLSLSSLIVVLLSEPLSPRRLLPNRPDSVVALRC